MDATNPVTPPTPAPDDAGPGGGRETTPARTPGPLVRAAARIGESPWAPVAAKATAILAGMLVLAGIGAASIANGRGVPVAAAAPAPSTASAVWMAPVRAAPHEAAAPATAAPPASASNGNPPTRSLAETTDGRIVLNLATAAELVKLPRVGPKRAQAILDLRARLGKFRQPTDLLRVRGIGRTTLRLMLPKLVVDPPRTAEATAQGGAPK